MLSMILYDEGVHEGDTGCMWSVGKVQFHGVTKSIFRSKYATYLSIRIYHVHNESMGCEGKRVKKISFIYMHGMA